MNDSPSLGDGHMIVESERELRLLIERHLLVGLRSVYHEVLIYFEEYL